MALDWQLCLLAGTPLLGSCALVLNPGADAPLSPLAESALEGVRQRGVATRARSLDPPPDLEGSTRVRSGAVDYEGLCAGCHLAPGREPGQLTRGMQPRPPELARMTGMDPREVFWTIKHGIKLTGMPGWAGDLEDDAIWDLTAFVQVLPSLSPSEYARLAIDPSGGPEEHAPSDEHASDEHAPSDETGGHAHGELNLLRRMELRDASGTAWQPETTPMAGIHAVAGPAEVMVHGNVFVLYDVQGSARGDQALASVNWVMGHAMWMDDDSAISARAMLSLEPLTVGGAGYPLLGQTGESWLGEPLVDRQHPHDLFMELALRGRQTFGDTAGAELYLAVAGEPALGPGAYPHRASAISDPFAPLGHHWEDATHLAFGVATAGIFNEWAKLEGSWFNGREPDEDRWDLDLAVPDSWASRLNVSVLPMLTAQLSYAWLAEPEALEPGVAVHRITASATLDHDGPRGNWATTAAWGRNVTEGGASDAVLAESDLAIGGDHIYGRVEYVVKSAVELGIPVSGPDARWGLTSLSLGNVYAFRVHPLDVGLGVRGNVLLVPGALVPTYGARAVVGGVVYLQVRPAGAKRAP